MTGMRPLNVLFVCSRNAVRSPMAAALATHLCGDRIHAESAGVSPEIADSIATQVMAEMGIDISTHEPRALAGARASAFDLIVTLSGSARAEAAERAPDVAAEHWPTTDTTAFEGSREMRLAAYRELRDKLVARITERFGAA